jgi:hypothetical protein
MAIVRQLYLFSWRNFHEQSDTLGDLERLQLVIETMPDATLMSTLRMARGHGRNDHPVEAVWNSILAGIVYGHTSIESLRRELRRNAQLREMCGFNPLQGVYGVPSKSAYNRFLAHLVEHEPLVREMFDYLVKQLMSDIPKFGTNLAGDGKAIHSQGKPSKKRDDDKRRETDADWGVKRYHGVNQDGKGWEKVKSWFGFRLHLVVDADAELPVGYAVTKASTSEQPVMDALFTELEQVHPELLATCEHALFDKGYDTTARIKGLWNKYGIKAICDIRHLWQGEDKTRQLRTKNISNVTYDYKGVVFCHCPKTGEMRRMSYSGFEARRETLKYRCPALVYGITCKGAAQCPIYQKSIRIPLREDPRVFTPVPRSSYKWEALYNKRSSVERVNSRIDTSFGFERHYIRGLKKMQLRCGLALTVMLAIAVGRLRQQRPDLMRSTVKATA